MQSYTRYPRAILWLLREGEVTIGGPDADSQPPFRARVGAFYLGQEPITNAQYAAFDPGHARSPASASDEQSATGISLEAATAYCDWYAGVSRKPTRLPTEIEWEYACRAGTTSLTFFGDDPDRAEAYVWDRRNTAGSLPPLRRKQPNPSGLYGMLGGVWEWTCSVHRPYPLTANEPDGELEPDRPRVLRGGSFRSDRADLCSGVRRAAHPGTAADDIGFRILRPFR